MTASEEARYWKKKYQEACKTIEILEREAVERELERIPELFQDIPRYEHLTRKKQTVYPPFVVEEKPKRLQFPRRR